jgi:DNA topoisomerase-1
LYERAYISYPRTSSQKLPPSLGLKGIIEELSKIAGYEAHARSLLKESRLKPIEGKKEDEAHPAIYPTGVKPMNLTKEEEMLYDLIVRRFLSCFAEPALTKKAKVTARFGNDLYNASGSLILKKGWLNFYPFVNMAEQQLPDFKKGEKVKATKIDLKDMQTQPPRRYAKAGLIAELEKRELGTKATRAAIIDTLLKRGYIIGPSLTVTKFGLSVFEALEKNCNMIVDESTTRKLEEDMESISKGRKTEQEVIQEGKDMLLEALKAFDTNKEKISEAMKKALQESVAKLGKCPKDGGDLVIRRSRVGKTFAACANYPKCTNTYSLPQFAKIEPTGNTCEHCKTPIIKVIRSGKRPFEMDLDPNCITKKDWKKEEPKGKVETVVLEKKEHVQVKQVKKVKPPKKTKAKPKRKKKGKTKTDDNVYS